MSTAARASVYIARFGGVSTPRLVRTSAWPEKYLSWTLLSKPETIFLLQCCKCVCAGRRRWNRSRQHQTANNDSPPLLLQHRRILINTRDTPGTQRQTIATTKHKRSAKHGRRRPNDDGDRARERSLESEPIHTVETKTRRRTNERTNDCNPQRQSQRQTTTTELRLQ